MRNSTSHLTTQALIRLTDQEMEPREAAEAWQHLEACGPCRARWKELNEVLGELGRLRGPLPRHTPASRERFQARLAEAAAQPRERGFRHVFSMAAAAVLAVLAILAVSSSSVSAEGPKPKRGLTPGETRPVSLAEICRVPESGPEIRFEEIPFEIRRTVFSAYGMDTAQAAAYEVDYLITPELGGARTVRNLWPQPYSARWNARVKDRLEHRLHQLVCQGKVDLATAQHEIATDWIGAYRKYVAPDAPR